MNINTSRSFHALALACSIAFLQAVSQADCIIKENFSTPLSSETWGISDAKKVNSAEGILSLTAQGPETSYAITNIQMTAPNELLNFTKRQVEIQFADLELTGDVPPQNREFFILMYNFGENSMGTSELRLRFDGSGGVMIAIYDKGVAIPVVSWGDSVVFPVKKVRLTLNPTGANLAVDDAKGPKNWHVPFNVALNQWTNAIPVISVQVMHNPGVAGAVQTKIKALRVDPISVP